MGFTPAGGLPMGTRTGDLDPGVAWYMMRSEKLTPRQFNNLINHESGLLDVSETCSEMRELKGQASEIPAAEAVDLFCYQARKWIGAFATALGGPNTLVFAGGIGENAGEVRARVCTGLQFLGVELDDARNDSNAPVISTATSRVTVRVMRTNEELMLARAVSRLGYEELKTKYSAMDDDQTRRTYHVNVELCCLKSRAISYLWATRTAPWDPSTATLCEGGTLSGTDQFRGSRDSNGCRTGF